MRSCLALIGSFLLLLRITTGPSSDWVSIGSITKTDDSVSFGSSLALNHNGTIVAVGDTAMARVTVFRHNGTDWDQIGSHILSTPSRDLVLNAKGTVLGIGKSNEFVKIYEWDSRGYWRPKGYPIDNFEYVIPRINQHLLTTCPVAPDGRCSRTEIDA